MKRKKKLFICTYKIKYILSIKGHWNQGHTSSLQVAFYEIDVFFLQFKPKYDDSTAIRIVEFSNGVYKIRKIFAYESTYSKEIIEFWELG